MSASPGSLGAAEVRGLWRRMGEIYGRRWTAQYGPPPPRGLSPVMATWARYLAGRSPADLARGLARAVGEGDPWPPSLPRFLAQCRPCPADYGLPPEAVALEEALSRRQHPRPGVPWSHPAVAAAARTALGRAWESRGAFEAGFLRAYRHAAGRVLCGLSPEAPPPEALGPPPEPPATRGEARRHLAALRAIVAPGGGTRARRGAA